jgi:hypothetical protein
MMGTYKFMMGTYKFMMGTYKFMIGTYKMQVMHKFVLVIFSIKSLILQQLPTSGHKNSDVYSSVFLVLLHVFFKTVDIFVQ